MSCCVRKKKQGRDEKKPKKGGGKTVLVFLGAENVGQVLGTRVVIVVCIVEY